MTRLTLAARNLLVQVPEVQALREMGRIGRGATWPDGWIFDSRPYATIEQYSRKALVVISYAGTWMAPNEHNSAHFHRLYVDIWASPTRLPDGTPEREDADMLIETVWEALSTHLHTVNRDVPSDGSVSPLLGLPGHPRVWGTAEEIEARTGVVVLGSQQLGEPDLSDVRDGNGARMGRYVIGVQTI